MTLKQLRHVLRVSAEPIALGPQQSKMEEVHNSCLRESLKSAISPLLDFDRVSQDIENAKEKANLRATQTVLDFYETVKSLNGSLTEANMTINSVDYFKTLLDFNANESSKSSCQHSFCN